MTELEGANAKQIAGNHYKTAVQHWDVLVDIGYGSEYYAAQVVKYLMRWRKKNGLRDVLKAQHFLEKMVELANGDVMFLKHAGGNPAEHEAFVTVKLPYLRAFYDANDVPSNEQIICTTVLFADGVGDLVAALSCFPPLIQEGQDLDAAGLREAEPPVAVQFSFLGYIQDNDNTHAGIQWKCKRCQIDIALGIDQPPNLYHACPMP